MFNRYYYFLLIKLVCHHQTSLMRFLLYRNCLNCLMKMKTDSSDRRTYTFWPWRLRQPPQHFEQFHNFAVFWDFNAMSIGNLVDWMTSILTSIASVSISSVSFYLMDWIIFLVIIGTDSHEDAMQLNLIPSVHLAHLAGSLYNFT